MLRTPNFGRKSLNEIKEVLSQMGLHLGMEIPNWPPDNIEEVWPRSWKSRTDRAPAAGACPRPPRADTETGPRGARRCRNRFPRTDRRTKGVGRHRPQPVPRRGAPAMEGDAPCVHGNRGRKFSRTSSHRKAMFSNMAAALLEHEQIVHDPAQGEGPAPAGREADHARQERDPGRPPPRLRGAAQRRVGRQAVLRPWRSAMPAAPAATPGC